MRAGLIPPDAADLPALPDRFAWALPHVKQPRRPMPESRQIVVDDEGPAVAAVVPSLGHASVVIGAHRHLETQRHYRTFASRETALRYAAQWAAQYRDRIIDEVDALRRHNAAPPDPETKGRLIAGPGTPKSTD